MVELIAAAVVFAFMVIEALRARNNERAQLTAGGVEPPGDVYRLMSVAYPAAFASMFIEGLIRGTPPASLVLAGTTTFALAKALKWWAILTLGRFWTFRIVVVPGAPRIENGPYRFLNHPNYVGVVGELVGVGLITGAGIAATLSTLVFGTLILKRIQVEERALAGRGPVRPSGV